MAPAGHDQQGAGAPWGHPKVARPERPQGAGEAGAGRCCGGPSWCWCPLRTWRATGWAALVPGLGPELLRLHGSRAVLGPEQLLLEDRIAGPAAHAAVAGGAAVAAAAPGAAGLCAVGGAGASLWPWSSLAARALRRRQTQDPVVRPGGTGWRRLTPSWGCGNRGNTHGTPVAQSEGGAHCTGHCKDHSTGSPSCPDARRQREPRRGTVQGN